MGRASKIRATENREKILRTASTLFRRRGISAVSIGEIMAEAGLTHGGFYGHFASKDDLAAEAISLSFEQIEETWVLAADIDGRSGLKGFAEAYLGAKHDTHCPMPTLAFEVAASPANSPTRDAYSLGVERLAHLLSQQEGPETGLGVLAALVGARLLRLAVTNATLADEIDQSVLAMIQN